MPPTRFCCTLFENLIPLASFKKREQPVRARFRRCNPAGQQKAKLS
jgi:hypothetical protein